jgi:hypothetical protein
MYYFNKGNFMIVLLNTVSSAIIENKPVNIIEVAGVSSDRFVTVTFQENLWIAYPEESYKDLTPEELQSPNIRSKKLKDGTIMYEILSAVSKVKLDNGFISVLGDPVEVSIEINSQLFEHENPVFEKYEEEGEADVKVGLEKSCSTGGCCGGCH